MALKRSLAGLIWAAILVAAVQFVPGAALAHDGHAHMAAAKSAPASTSKMIALTVAVAKKKVQAVVSSAAHEHAPAPTTSGNCTGGCCGNSTSCCGAVLLVDAASVSRDRPAPERAFLRTAPRSGLAPDELIRPPRILA